jgi:hypothetical protein
MRVALLLVVVLIACSKKAADKQAEAPRAAQPATEGAASAPADEARKTGAAAPPPSPIVGAAPAGAGSGSAVDDARASGVLGPTDRAAFEIKGTIAIKSASAALTKTVEAKRDALQACYDKALQFQDTLAGELVLDVKAGKLAVGRSTLKHAELETCIREALADAALPKGGKASVTLAFKRT